MKTITRTHSRTFFHELHAESVHEVLAPLTEAASESSSLVASTHPARVEGGWYEIPKYLLLGQRGGGQPVRLAIFAGLDAGAIETTAALARLLLQFELIPALARDYAVFGYPVVNSRGFTPHGETLREFETRYAEGGPGEDVAFFQSELRSWTFDGLLTLRLDREAAGFHATSRSKVLADEVVKPSLQAIATKLPLADEPVRLRSNSRHARLADEVLGKLTVSGNAQPNPFEIEIFAPAKISREEQITGLFLFVQEVLRNYRRVISHAQNI